MNKVLIIDDDPELQKFYTEALAKEQISVLSAYTGKEGLIKARQEMPDLIVLDIMLPGGMHGFDVGKELRSDAKLSTIPVLVLTNLGEERENAERIGAVDYIVKSNASMESIVDKIKTLVQKKETIQ